MTAATRLLTRVIVLISLMVASVTPPPQGDAAGKTAGEEATARSEVRLRKLHLVRPDLIPYPIAYEVCC